MANNLSIPGYYHDFLGELTRINNLCKHLLHKLLAARFSIYTAGTAIMRVIQKQNYYSLES